MVSLNHKHELFPQYKNGIVTFDHYNSFKNNFTTTLCHARNNYFQRKLAECSNNSRDTWKTLNSLIRYKNNSKDVILSHNGSKVSDPSAIAEAFNNYFLNIASNLDRNIPHSNIQVSLSSSRNYFRIFSCPISHATQWAWFNITILLANLLTEPSVFLLLQLYILQSCFNKKNVYLHWISWEHLWKINFSALPLIGKKLLISFIGRRTTPLTSWIFRYLYIKF